MRELDLLQAVRLKGRITLAELAANLDEDVAVVVSDTNSLAASGLVTTGAGLGITLNGRNRLSELLAEERAGVDRAAMTTIFREFRALNTELKNLVTQWQIRDDQPNAHDDDDYDAQILAQLSNLHDSVMPVIDAACKQIPRLVSYTTKLSTGLARTTAGERIWFTRPLIDSYHTVWFELYEELMLAAGLTREVEVEAGYLP